MMVMLCKYLGTAMVLFSSAGLGLWLSWQWKERLRLLERLRQMVYFLKGEITYSHAALAEALERVGRRDGGQLGVLFTEAASAISSQEGESFQEIWSSQTEVLRHTDTGRLLSPEDLEQLKALGSHLGYLDLDMQDRTLLLYLEQLEVSIQWQRDQLREKCRLYTSLGVAGGLFLVIIMF